MMCSGSVFFFFKQKTAYEMRISDWSSDVCSSDLCDRRILRSVEEVGAEQMRVEFVDASGDRSHVNTDVDTAALLGQIKRRGATCGIELAVKRREAEVAEREARERMVRIECVDRKSTRLNSSH